jgi:CubicO group peptidase (beta-lactamase class C family)
MISFCLLGALTVCTAPKDDPPFPRTEPAAVGIDPAALEKLKVKAESEGSDAVVIVKEGKLIADWDFGKPRGPIEAMSATKSVVNLAVGRLLDEGKIKSLDQPVADFFPEWRQGRKRMITVRQLLNHTSGLEDKPTTQEIYASPDFVQFALAADVASDPGTRFFYSNKATNLLAGVVLRASAKSLDEYLAREIFAPLGITGFGWSKDSAGNPHAMAGLQITAIDFAKIGQLMLDAGVWQGRQILSREWVAESIREGQPFNARCGLLWWRTLETTKLTIDDDFINELKTRFGLTESAVKKLEAMKGKLFEAQRFWPGLFSVFRDDENTRGRLNEINEQLKKNSPAAKVVDQGSAIAFSAQGYLGQYLVVVPRHRIVAVRQRRSLGNHDPNDSRNVFGDFEEMVRALAK